MLTDNPTIKPIWKDQKHGYEEALNYLKGRKIGNIRSILSPWEKFNDATTNGLEWHSMTVIAGRPGSGKTLMKDQFIREAFPLNPSEDFRVLEFPLEMLTRTTAIRQFSSHLGKTYKHLCSADTDEKGELTTLSTDDLISCFEFSKRQVKYPINIVEVPVSVPEFKAQISAYMDTHMTIEEVENKVGAKSKKPKYQNTIVTLDHSLLLKKSKWHGGKSDMLYDLGEALTELKRKYPIAFIILSQLNRNIDRPERNEDAKYGNYILESDIFGADALLQHADNVIGLNRPGKNKIRLYGPDKYIIEDEFTLVMHFLKCRNGDTRMSFFKAAFAQMKIEDMDTPPLASKPSN